MKTFEKWIKKPANWYQFWLPQSGFIGGLILGAFIYENILIIYLLLK